MLNQIADEHRLQIAEPVVMELHVERGRGDLDNTLKSVQDLLELAGVVQNDKWIRPEPYWSNEISGTLIRVRRDRTTNQE